MNRLFELDWSERIESLKAGAIAGFTVGITFTLTLLGNAWLAQRVASLASLAIAPHDWTLWLSLAIASLAGGLFGITYRYVIREDQNPHLKSGAVLAFGLVRGLAQVDVGLALQQEFSALAILALESVLLFAVARLILDSAIAGGWLKLFRSM